MKIHLPFHSTRRWCRVVMAIVAVACAGPTSTSAQTTQPVQLGLETAPSVAGPWTKVPVRDTLISGDGSLGLTVPAPTAFFRLKPEALAAGGGAPFIALADVPAAVRLRADRQYQELLQLDDLGGAPAEFGPWRGAVFAPLVIPMFDPTYRGGAEPAYYEFKLVAPRLVSGTPVDFLRGGERELPSADRGFLLLAMNEDGPPVPGFAVSGPTPCEKLLRAAPSLGKARLFRFGPTFMTLEDGAGQLLANFGTQPFKLDPSVLTLVGRRLKGIFDSDTAVTEPGDGSGGPPLRVDHFPSYESFKSDYVNNPVMQKLREHRAKRVRAEWDLVKGLNPTLPAVINVPAKTQINIFPGEVITEFFLDEDNEAQATALVIVDRTNGGLRITGEVPGDVDLTVRRAAGVERHVIHVHLPGQAAGGQPRLLTFTPGWQPAKIWTAGGYDEQPRYYQLKDDRWCDLVGCGPVAWAILLAWWDRHEVPSAFYEATSYQSLNFSLRTADAPKYIDDSLMLIKQQYDEIHDACDVICNIVSGAGGTLPGDMIEAVYPVTSLARGWQYGFQQPDALRYMGMSFGWAWDLMDPDWNEPSNVIRKSVKAGRPAIVGLGWLWHYGVAYAYLAQDWKVSAEGPAMFNRRWFKVNEGWGKDNGEWYSGGDTFLGTNLKFWQRHLPPP